MLHRILPFAVLVSGLTGATSAQAETLYVRAGRLVDPEAGKVLTAQVLKVEDGRVTAVGPEGALPAGAKVLDWSQFTVLPGLIDCHVHLADFEQSNNVAEPLLHSAMETVMMGARNARKTLLPGSLRCTMSARSAPMPMSSCAMRSTGATCPDRG